MKEKKEIPPPPTGRPAARCVICDHEVTASELANGPRACPKCGDTGVPCNPVNDVTVKINWHELHILSVWAEHWAKHLDKSEPDKKAGQASDMQTVISITRRLEAQHPDIQQPLTLGGEIRQLKEAFGEENIETNIQHDPGFDPTTDDLDHEP